MKSLNQDRWHPDRFKPSSSKVCLPHYCNINLLGIIVIIILTTVIIIIIIYITLPKTILFKLITDTYKYTIILVTLRHTATESSKFK
jgi:hypothetical protein